jgi:hypothetical protein
MSARSDRFVWHLGVLFSVSDDEAARWLRRAAIIVLPNKEKHLRAAFQLGAAVNHRFSAFNDQSRRGGQSTFCPVNNLAFSGFSGAFFECSRVTVADLNWGNLDLGCVGM